MAGLLLGRVCKPRRRPGDFRSKPCAWSSLRGYLASTRGGLLLSHAVDGAAFFGQRQGWNPDHLAAREVLSEDCLGSLVLGLTVDWHQNQTVGHQIVGVSRIGVGTCREPAWGEANCMRPHVVYLANSSGVNIGITRESQVPIRWIDQGAAQALPVARVASRRLSGLMEVAFKEHVADRTDWRRMLKGEPESVDLAATRDTLLEQCGEALSDVTDEHDSADPEFIADAESLAFHYPVLEYPAKVASINLDKTPEIEGTLMGIKGQYLILDTGVINIRKYGGYEVAVTT